MIGDAMIITFFGHSKINVGDCLYQNIKKAITDSIENSDKILFYCGGYGDFDNLCAKACHSIKEEQDNCEVIFVTPYITESHQNKIKHII